MFSCGQEFKSPLGHQMMHTGTAPGLRSPLARPLACIGTTFVCSDDGD